jgi:4-hydroxy-3-polyprenylbenzoate decarboxylase
MDAKRDVVITEGPLDVLDHTSPMWGWGGKMGIDATRKWKEEGFSGRWPDAIVMSPEVKAKIDRLWPALGIKPGPRG